MFHRVAPILAVAALPFLPSPLSAQGDSLGVPSRSHVGLEAIGAVAAQAGWASIQRGIHAGEVGAVVDFGYIRSSRIRLLADVAYLLTLPHEERVETEGRTYRDVFRDLSGHLSVAVHPFTPPTTRFSPYVLAGVGVHVLSSSFESLTIDTRYNTNNFGLLTAAGARLRLGAGRRYALQLEGRVLQARNVNRVSVHLGLASLFNDLARH